MHPTCRTGCSVLCFNDPATTAIYTLSLHDALPICDSGVRDGLHRTGPVDRAFHLQVEFRVESARGVDRLRGGIADHHAAWLFRRSEEHTSELQSRENLVCRLLLEKKNNSNDLREYL